MERTTNFGLYKPGTDDFINIDDLNANMDIIDEALAHAGGGGIAFSAALKTRSVKGFASSVELIEET